MEIQGARCSWRKHEELIQDMRVIKNREVENEGGDGISRLVLKSSPALYASIKINKIKQ